MVHENLTGLVGVWRGRGRGEYPTIDPFDYGDELVISDSGRGFLQIQQTTQINGEPRHVEVGYLRTPTADSVELVIAIPTGQAELGVGACLVDDDGTVHVTTVADVLNAPSAKEVSQIVRSYRLQGDTLEHELRMVSMGQELTVHLTSTLTRVSG